MKARARLTALGMTNMGCGALFQLCLFMGQLLNTKYGVSRPRQPVPGTSRAERVADVMRVDFERKNQGFGIDVEVEDGAVLEGDGENVVGIVMREAHLADHFACDLGKGRDLLVVGVLDVSAGVGAGFAELGFGVDFASGVGFCLG